MLTAALGGGGDAPAVSEVGADVEVVARAQDVTTDVVAVGDVLLAPLYHGRGADPGTRALYRSEYSGRTWDPIGLPGAPNHVYDQGLEPVRVGDVVVVAGREVEELHGTDNDPYGVPARNAYVWTTRDGRVWQGGVLVDARVSGEMPVVRAVGDVLIAGIEVGQSLWDDFTTYALYRSDDDGASWTRAVLWTPRSH